jgi:signal recognition particle receptor subunit beta
VHLVDVPGHPRVRRGFQAHLPSARGVVFVLDSVDFLPHKTETAECAPEAQALFRHVTNAWP